jgi:hypothetical protein
LPGRSMQSLADGGYATKDYVRRRPKAVHIVGRFPMSATLYDVPPPRPPKQRGAPRKKGALIGSPKTLAQTATGWSPHPSAVGAEIHAWDGLWHAVLPGRLVRVVYCDVRTKPPHTAWPQKTAPRHRSLLHHRSLLERGRDRARVWPPLGRGNCHP